MVSINSAVSWVYGSKVSVFVISTALLVGSGATVIATVTASGVDTFPVLPRTVSVTVFPASSAAGV